MDWERLGRFVRDARGTRSQKDISDNGGPSDETISKIEHGKWRPKRSVADTLGKLETAFQWAPGSADLVLRGGVPIVRTGGTADDRGPNMSDEFEAVKTEALRQLAERDRTVDIQTRKLVDLWRQARPLSQPDIFLATSDIDGLTDAAVSLAREVSSYAEQAVGGYSRMQALAQARVDEIDRESGQQRFFEPKEKSDVVETEASTGASTEGDKAEEELLNEAERARNLRRLQARLSPNAVPVEDTDDSRDHG